MEFSERICRICLQSELNSEFTQINKSNNDIAQNIFLIAAVKIIELSEYNVPALICNVCLKELFQCILFRKKCQSADEYFRTKFANAKVEEKIWISVETELEDIKEVPEGLNLDLVSNVNEVEVYPTKTEDFLNDQFTMIEDNVIDDECVEALDFEESEKVTPETKAKPIKRKPARRKNSLQCRYCGITLSRRNRRIEHERLHLVDTQQVYECSICGKSFNQKFGLVPHFKKFHNFVMGPTEKWKCAICVDKVLPPGNMGLHYEKYHADICCSFNSKKIPGTSLGDLGDVIEPKKPQRKKPKVAKNFWPCSICGNSFSNYQRYHRHLKEVHEVSDSQVIQDTAALKNAVEVANVLKKEKQIDKKPRFPCTTCGKAFASIMTVRAHEKTHLNIEYTCDLCGSAFRVKAYLTAHVQKVHMKLKKFKCSIENCSASFVHRELLNYHVRKHLNIRNFSCRYCGKTFVTRSCCKIHERIHTDERPYSCRFCDRTFIHHSDHRRHETKHNNADARIEKHEFIFDHSEQV